MLNKKTLINNKNTKKSENKGLTPAVDMIQYTDIMTNNNNKKDTMTKKVKNTVNPNQLASAYFLYCNLSNTYKIGISRKASTVAKRVRALKIRYGYGDHLNTIATTNAKYSDTSALEKYLHKKYASVKTKRIAKVIHENKDGSTFTTEFKLNGANEWFSLNNDQVEEVKTYFKMA
jgi:hypothetical protein